MRTIYFIFFFMCLSGAIYAQSAEDLTGTWTIQWTAIRNKMSSAEQTRFNGMPAEVKTKIQNSFSERTYSFSANGNLSVRWQSAQGQKNETGTWSLSSNELVLSVNGTERRYTMSREGELLVLSSVTQMTGATFSKLVLEKN